MSPRPERDAGITFNIAHPGGDAGERGGERGREGREGGREGREERGEGGRGGERGRGGRERGERGARGGRSEGRGEGASQTQHGELLLFGLIPAAREHQLDRRLRGV